MQIRTKLTLQFMLLGGMIMIIASLAIYFSSAGFRRDDFYNRLRSKARLTARLVIDADVPDTSQLKRIDKDFPYNLHNERIVILNYLNDIVFTSDPKSEIILRYDILERIRLYQRMFYKQGSYEVLGTLYTTPDYRYVVLAAATDVEGLAHLKQLRIILLLVFGTSMLLFYLAGTFFAGRALKPINDVVNRVEEISITSLDLRVPVVNRNDEIGRLAKNFNSMLQRLQVSFGMQKDFIANASHELRTPLTSINGQLEVLMIKDRTTDEYKSTVASVLEDIKALINLTNRLLLLARTSSENQPASKTPVRVDELLWQIKDDLKKYNKSSHVYITMDPDLYDSDQMTVYGDEYLLRTAFLNIADNACKYSADHSVMVMLKQVNGSLIAEFSDKGAGISESELKKIFEPFYRSSDVKNIPGSGIGLPLVNHIINLHRGTVTIQSKVGSGTTVKISLPAN
jgi:signal transduction histidine kinase